MGSVIGTFTLDSDRIKNMGNLKTYLLALAGPTLISGCSFLPQSFSLPNNSPVKRLYCSVKSIGIDLHFNKKTGQLYTFNEFNQSLEPFALEKEIPFNEFIPEYTLKEGLSSIGGPEGSLEDGNLAIKVFDKSDAGKSVRVLINLETLQTKLDLSKIGTGYDAPSESDAAAAKAFVNKSLTCEYIPPQSTKLS